MLHVDNQTPFGASLFLAPDVTGVDTAWVVVKATFEIGPKSVSVAAAQTPIVAGDECWGDPKSSSIRYAGEVHPAKPATDVALVGGGHAPGGRPVPGFGVSLTVGPLKKVVHVHGDRAWQRGLVGPSISKPAPVTEVPLRYELAYGGRHDLANGELLADLRNPVGRGFLGKRSASELIGLPLPNLEHPKQWVTSPGDKPPPACFGFIAPWWEPRRRYTGTFDEAWRTTRAPYWPLDLDPRFFQAVPPDQVVAGGLRGGEPVEIVNASPRGVQRFALPAIELGVTVRIGREEHRPRLRLETLLLEPDRDRFSMTWRGGVTCDKRSLRVETATVTLEALEGVAG
ncbi:MAG: DUF2169 domain-containing protein [Anaeromyxobacteraceae bacterium]